MTQQEFKQIFVKNAEEQLHQHVVYCKGITYPAIKNHYLIVTATVDGDDNFIFGLIPIAKLSDKELTQPDYKHAIRIDIPWDQCKDVMYSEFEVCDDSLFESTLNDWKEAMQKAVDLIKSKTNDTTQAITTEL